MDFSIFENIKLNDEIINQLVEKRKKARKQLNFIEAEFLRDFLKKEEFF